MKKVNQFQREFKNIQLTDTILVNRIKSDLESCGDKITEEMRSEKEKISILMGRKKGIKESYDKVVSDLKRWEDNIIGYLQNTSVDIKQLFEKTEVAIQRIFILRKKVQSIENALANLENIETEFKSSIQGASSKIFGMHRDFMQRINSSKNQFSIPSKDSFEEINVSISNLINAIQNFNISCCKYYLSYCFPILGKKYRKSRLRIIGDPVQKSSKELLSYMNTKKQELQDIKNRTSNNILEKKEYALSSLRKEEMRTTSRLNTLSNCNKEYLDLTQKFTEVKLEALIDKIFDIRGNVEDAINGMKDDIEGQLQYIKLLQDIQEYVRENKGREILFRGIYNLDLISTEVENVLEKRKILLKSNEEEIRKINVELSENSGIIKKIQNKGEKMVERLTQQFGYIRSEVEKAESSYLKEFRKLLPKDMEKFQIDLVKDINQFIKIAKQKVQSFLSREFYKKKIEAPFLTSFVLSKIEFNIDYVVNLVDKFIWFGVFGRRRKLEQKAIGQIENILAYQEKKLKKELKKYFQKIEEEIRNQLVTLIRPRKAIIDSLKNNISVGKMETENLEGWIPEIKEIKKEVHSIKAKMNKNPFTTNYKGKMKGE